MYHSRTPKKTARINIIRPEVLLKVREPEHLAMVACGLALHTKIYFSSTITAFCGLWLTEETRTRASRHIKYESDTQPDAFNQKPGVARVSTEWRSHFYSPPARRNGNRVAVLGKALKHAASLRLPRRREKILFFEKFEESRDLLHNQMKFAWDDDGANTGLPTRTRNVSENLCKLSSISEHGVGDLLDFILSYA